MNEEEKPTARLKDVDKQLKELLDLIEKKKDFRFSMKRKKTKKKWWILACLFFVSISIVWFLSNDQFTYDIYFFFLSLIRLILIKILPYWDWTSIYTNHCFISNPFFNHSLDLIECNKCVNTSTIVRQSNMTFFNFTKSIYLNHLPVIVEDATQTWPAMKGLTVEKLFRLFVEDSVLAEYDLCYFEANLRGYNQLGGADELFNDYLKGKRRSFVVHWNNCKRETLKVLRRFYHKPYFLPPSVGQTLMGNWFLVSAGFEKNIDRLYKIPLNYNWIWMAQIQGSSLIELEAKYPCEKICPIIRSIKMHKGDLIMFSHLYEARYTPLNRETILLAQGVD